MRRMIDEWQRRIKTVEREFTSMRFAADRLFAEAVRDSAVLKTVISLRDIRQASSRLDGTYIIRLFAEFETGLRQFWLAARGTDPPARTRDLLDGVAASRKIPDHQLVKAHKVRIYRNHLIHERDEPLDPVSVAEARHSLCRFFSYLPPNW